jgi:hypothetical protein
VARLWAMRITKLPIPLLIAAAALTSVAVIYVYLTAPPMPIHTDRNFTTPLFAGGTYMWRGAAFEYIMSADNVISVSYMPPYHLIYLTGPLVNLTIGDRIWIIYVFGERPLYVVKQRVYDSYGFGGVYGEKDEYFVFKLVEVTPPNLTISNLTVWLPTPFALGETLSNKEWQALYARVPSGFRATGVEVNSTHVIFKASHIISGDSEYRFPARLPSPTSGRTIRVTNKPISSSYVASGYTFMAMALPYHHFAIVPQDTTTLVIYVS